jgi:hypothetical protein
MTTYFFLSTIRVLNVARFNTLKRVRGQKDKFRLADIG